MRARCIHFIAGFLNSCFCVKLYKQYAGLWHIGFVACDPTKKFPQSSSAPTIVSQHLLCQKERAQGQVRAPTQTTLILEKTACGKLFMFLLFKPQWFSYSKSYSGKLPWFGILQKLLAGSHVSRIRNIKWDLDTKRKLKTICE